MISQADKDKLAIPLKKMLADDPEVIMNTEELLIALKDVLDRIIIDSLDREVINAVIERLWVVEGENKRLEFELRDTRRQLSKLTNTEVVDISLNVRKQ
jgi:hypothetical protein